VTAHESKEDGAAKGSETTYTRSETRLTTSNDAFAAGRSNAPYERRRTTPDSPGHGSDENSTAHDSHRDAATARFRDRAVGQNSPHRPRERDPR
jgi:hypothetical protein